MAYSPATEQEAAEDMDIDLNSAPSTPDSPVTPSSPASSTGTICHSISASPAEHREHASEESTTPVLNSPIYHDSKINLVTSMLLITVPVKKTHHTYTTILCSYAKTTVCSCNTLQYTTIQLIVV